MAAEGLELAGVRRQCQRLERLRWPVKAAWLGKLNGVEVVLVANGMGRRRAAEAVRTACQRVRVDAVVSTGWCGALDAELAPGEIVVASSVEAENGGTRYECKSPRAAKAFRTGRLVTVNRVVVTAQEKARLRATTGAAAVDMEAAGAAAEAARRGLGFYCIRVVLETSEETFGLDFNAARQKDGWLSKMKIVRAALAHPWKGVPELVRWYRRSREAARALGRFVAGCSFDH